VKKKIPARNRQCYFRKILHVAFNIIAFTTRKGYFMAQDKDDGEKVIIVPCKERFPVKPERGTGDFSERKAPAPVRDTIPPPKPQEPEK
jgi:hypothetical protein